MNTLQRVYWGIWATFGLVVGAIVGWTIAGLLGATLGGTAGAATGIVAASLGPDAVFLLLRLFD